MSLRLRILFASLSAFTVLAPFSGDSSPVIAAEPAYAAGSTAPRTADEKAAFQAIQSRYSANAQGDVVTLVDAYLKTFPQSTRRHEALNYKGLAQLLLRESGKAAETFGEALSLAPNALAGDHNWRNYVGYNRAAALLDSGSAKGAIAQLGEIDPDSLDAPNRLKYFLLKARAHDRADEPESSLRAWMGLDRRREELDLSRVAVVDHVDAVLKKITSLDELEAIEREAEAASFADLISFRRLEVTLAKGRSSEAREGLRNFLKVHATSRKVEAAGALLRGLREKLMPGEMSIGLLIPQQGKFAKYGQRVLQAVTLGLGIFGPPSSAGAGSGKVQLVVEDSGDTPESALRALERLHTKHRVAAVLGPISSRGADAVIQRAEELGIPIVSLAQQPGKLGEFSTQGAITPAMQTRELARHAIEKMGIRRFAILSPNDRFGSEYSQEFWNAVEEFGGTVTAFENYESGETDFRKPVDRLAGLFYQDARRRELTALAEAREKEQIKKRTRKTEKYFALEPVADFDAIFIPDEPKAASLAIPTFAYRDIDRATVLGISAWNSSDFVQRAQKTAENTVFLDAWHARATAPAARKFGEHYKTAFGQDAASLDAVAFDAAGVLARLLEAEGSTSVDRSSLASRIRQIRDLPGASGRISVTEGNWTRDLRVLTVRNGEIVEWTGMPAPAPSSATSAD